MSGPDVLLESDGLRAFYAEYFLRRGVRPEDAVIAASGIHYADVRGIDSHGLVNFVRIYAPGLERGEIVAAAEPRRVGGRGACAVFDAERALGFVAGTVAMQAAIAAARDHGLGMSAVRGCTHAGAMGFFAMQAADAGMVGLAFTNLGSQALIPPPGGTRPLLGTNVVCAAAPAEGRPAFCIDMATSAVSTGRVRVAARRGETIPAGWLADQDGNPVTDPAALDRGEARLTFLGAASATGYKGFGLALLCDVLCGVLAGAAAPALTASHAMPDTTGAPGTPGADIGLCFAAIDPSAFRDGFGTTMAALLDGVTASPTRDGEPAAYPGLPESRAMEERARDGVSAHPTMYEAMVRIAGSVGMEGPPVVSGEW